MKEVRKEIVEFFQKERDERIRLEKELNEKINKMEEDINYIKKMPSISRNCKERYIKIK